MKKEAMLYEKLDSVLNCHVCHRRCIISNGKTGFCEMRQNEFGTLYTLNYAATSSVAVDPIEKKPLFHFYPGSMVLSLGSLGCNFRCRYCQNWNISQADIKKTPTSSAMKFTRALRSSSESLYPGMTRLVISKWIPASYIL